MISIDITRKLGNTGSAGTLRVKFDADKGSIIKIHGPSGAGKTTLLKIIAGLTEVDTGKVVFDNQVWLDTATNTNLRPQLRAVGFVFQDYALFPNMTVSGHLRYATTDQAWIDTLLRIGKLENYKNSKPPHLSGGQQQRLAILRAMAIKPRLLLMDEPFSALDPATKSHLIADLTAIWKEAQTTVLLVSHNPLELEKYRDEVFINWQ